MGSRRDFLKKIVLLGIGAAVAGTIADRMLRRPEEKVSEAADTYQGTTIKIGEATLPLVNARYFTQLGGNIVRCDLCPNGCMLGENQRGLCGVRINVGGRLYTMAYGNPCAVHVDPIEKKPMFHFIPATGAFSIATAGCNLRCIFCQNWQISQARPEETKNYELSPSDVVSWAVKTGCRSVAYTYTEPTVFYEYMVDTSNIARRNGIKNVWVTCGYINPDPLRELCRCIDGANVDLKGFDGFYGRLNAGKLEPVLQTLKILKDEGVWFEITNLVIPTQNDDMDRIREMCEWIKRELGVDYPVHFTRFFPAYKLSNLYPTPVETLENARKIATDVGIKFAYVGNVPGHEWNSTYCPKCGRLIIKRVGFFVQEFNLADGACRYCGEKIPGVWS